MLLLPLSGLDILFVDSICSWLMLTVSTSDRRDGATGTVIWPLCIVDAAGNVLDVAEELASIRAGGAPNEI